MSILNEATLQEIKEKIDNGLFPQWLMADEQIYEAELEKIFNHTWQFLGHETELKEPGDFVTRWLVNDPIILVKNKRNEIKGFLNSCTHRGVHLCTADAGSNKKTFQCPYHGWSFNTDGELVGVVAGDKFFDSDVMDRKKWGLLPIPQLATYKGLIFGNLDPNAEPLDDYLGDLKYYWDIWLGRTDGGMEVRGEPQRWVVNTNWKLPAENFTDPYHVQTTHRSTVELGISPQDPLFSSYGHQVVLNNGHGAILCTADAPGLKNPPYQGLPKEMWPMFERNLNKEQLKMAEKTVVLLGTCFPNLSYLSPMHGTEGHLTSFFNLRVWRPLGPRQVEIISWCLVYADATEEYKDDAYKGYIGSFGPSGTLEQDDTEIWTRIADVSKATMARNKNLDYNNYMNFLMGIGKYEQDTSWPGPGTAYATCFTDAIARSIHKRWFEIMSKDQLSTVTR